MLIGVVIGALFLFFAGAVILSLAGVEEEYPIKTDSEETTLHEQEPPDPLVYADVRLLAKIMQAESGIDWPDWAVMCIGEVVLNRVASPLFPDTIYDVLHQGPPIQYAPVWEPGWKDLDPGPEYIALARRLLNGERVFKNPRIIWQALFPQGDRVVLTYYDKTLDTTTYFCE